jgi:HPt (histidine-containing phosphotransfer) domain-containing protein
MQLDAGAYDVAVSRDIGDLMPAYMKNRRKELAALQEALAAADYAQLRQIGHRMTGVGDPYGFSHVTMLGKQIENSAAREDRAELEALVRAYGEYLPNIKISYV